MEVIPVIDLLNGVVVHAQKGQRNHYSPIRSALCRVSKPKVVVSSLLSIFPFKTIYIADLNALMKTGDNNPVIQSFLENYPNKKFWVDQGLAMDQKFSSAQNLTPVIGSESVTADTVNDFKTVSLDFVLSLDFQADRMLGYERLFYDSDLWPDKVIIMSLSKVGTDCGPDIGRLKYFQNHWPDTSFIAAGGLRDETDLELLHNNGIKTVLTATALHSGKLTPDILSRC